MCSQSRRLSLETHLSLDLVSDGLTNSLVSVLVLDSQTSCTSMTSNSSKGWIDKLLGLGPGIECLGLGQSGLVHIHD